MYDVTFKNGINKVNKIIFIIHVLSGAGVRLKMCCINITLMISAHYSCIILQYNHNFIL